MVAEWKWVSTLVQTKVTQKKVVENWKGERGKDLEKIAS